MAKVTYEEAFKELEAIERDYFPTLERYKEKGGDIEVFTDFHNRVIKLWDYISELPEDDNYFEILEKLLWYRGAIDALMH